MRRRLLSIAIGGCGFLNALFPGPLCAAQAQAQGARPTFGVDLETILILAVLMLAAGWALHLRRCNRRLLALSSRLQEGMGAREAVEMALRESEERYRLLVETAQEGIVVTQDGALAYFNPAMASMLGYDGDELRNRPLLDIIYPDDRELALGNHQKRLAGEALASRYRLRLRHKNGSPIWVEVSGVRIVWDSRFATLNVISDITQTVEIEKQITHLAKHDNLTGLPNRSLFSDRLNRALALAQRDCRRLAVLFVDLNRFKEVNDTLGHGIGDLLLQEVAERLRQSVRKSDTVARIGGDEFILLLPEIERVADASVVADKIRRLLRDPFALSGQHVEISASVGVAVFPDDGGSEAELWRKADAAMYREKNRRRIAAAS